MGDIKTAIPTRRVPDRELTEHQDRAKQIENMTYCKDAFRKH